MKYVLQLDHKLGITKKSPKSYATIYPASSNTLQLGCKKTPLLNKIKSGKQMKEFIHENYIIECFELTQWIRRFANDDTVSLTEQIKNTDKICMFNTIVKK